MSLSQTFLGGGVFVAIAVGAFDTFIGTDIPDIERVHISSDYGTVICDAATVMAVDGVLSIERESCEQPENEIGE